MFENDNYVTFVLPQRARNLDLIENQLGRTVQNHRMGIRELLEPGSQGLIRNKQVVLVGTVNTQQRVEQAASIFTGSADIGQAAEHYADLHRSKFVDVILRNIIY